MSLDFDIHVQSRQSIKIDDNHSYPSTDRFFDYYVSK